MRIDEVINKFCELHWEYQVVDNKRREEIITKMRELIAGYGLDCDYDSQVNEEAERILEGLPLEKPR